MAGPPVIRLYFREYTSPIATDLEEMLLIHRDIEASVHGMSLWLSRYVDYGPVGGDPLSDDHLIAESLYRDAIIRFVSCFDSKEPHKLNAEEIFGPHPGALRLFHSLVEIRNSYIGHRFGPLRQALVGPELDPEDPDKRLVGQFLMIFDGPEKKGGEYVALLMKLALQHVNASLRVAKEAFSKEIDALSTEAIQAMPMAEVTAPARENVRISREQWKKKAKSRRRGPK